MKSGTQGERGTRRAIGRGGEKAGGEAERRRGLPFRIRKGMQLGEAALESRVEAAERMGAERRASAVGSERRFGALAQRRDVEERAPGEPSPRNGLRGRRAARNVNRAKRGRVLRRSRADCRRRRLWPLDAPRPQSPWIPEATRDRGLLAPFCGVLRVAAAAATSVHPLRRGGLRSGARAGHCTLPRTRRWRPRGRSRRPRG